MRTVVLVHGFWHGPWSWSLVAERLAARGVPSVAVDVEGLGLLGAVPAATWARPFDPARFATEPAPVAAVTASSAAATLVEQIRRIGNGEPCVVVAHSMGGVVATAAAEREPSLFAHLMYVTGFVPVSGMPAAAYLPTPENAGELVTRLFAADPRAVGAVRLDIGAAGRHAALRETFYPDVDPAIADAAIALLTPDSPAGIFGEAFPVTSQRYGAVPHTYAVCTKDNAVPPALQRRFVREIDAVSQAPARVVELDSGHVPLLSQPDAVAAAIAGIW